MRVVKSFANESIEEEKFSQGNGRFLDIKKEQYFYMAGFNSMTRIFDGLMYVAVLVAGALFMIAGRITAGDLMAYLLYVTALLTSIRRIVEFTEQFQRGMTGIERFIEVIDAPEMSMAISLLSMLVFIIRTTSIACFPISICMYILAIAWRWSVRPAAVNRRFAI